MSLRHPLFPLAILAGAGLAGCAPQGPFPSLALRPEEGSISVAEPVRPPVLVASDPALRAQIGALRERGRASARAFDAAFPAADRATRGAGGAGSEGWIAAQVAVSRLEETRVGSASALAELDRLSLARAEQPTNAEDYALIEAAMAELTRATTERQARFDALRSRLGR